MHAARAASWGLAGTSAGRSSRRANLEIRNLEIRGRVRVAMRPGWPMVPLVAQSSGLTSFEHTPVGQESLTAVASVGAATAWRVGADGFLMPCRA